MSPKGGPAGTPFNPASSYVWTGQNNMPPCPLTDAATIVSSAASCAAGSAYGTNMQAVMLLAPGHTIAVPTGLHDGQRIVFHINHGTGPYNPTLAAGFVVPNRGAVPSWCSTANCVDDLSCYGYGGSSPTFVSTTIECPGFGGNISPPAIAAMVADISPSSIFILSTDQIGTTYQFFCTMNNGTPCLNRQWSSSGEPAFLTPSVNATGLAETLNAIPLPGSSGAFNVIAQ